MPSWFPCIRTHIAIQRQYEYTWLINIFTLCRTAMSFIVFFCAIWPFHKKMFQKLNGHIDIIQTIHGNSFPKSINKHLCREKIGWCINIAILKTRTSTAGFDTHHIPYLIIPIITAICICLIYQWLYRAHQDRFVSIIRQQQDVHHRVITLVMALLCCFHSPYDPINMGAHSQTVFNEE